MIAGEGANQISKDMAERKRNAKGQFVKGNDIGQRFQSTDGQAAEIGRRGGIASAEAKKRHKLLKEVLMEQLGQEVTTKSGEKITRREAIVAATLKNLYDKPSAKGLKIISEILGEMEINVNVRESEKPKIVFSKKDE